MKAMICTEYGSPAVMQLKELEKPTPRENEVSIKIYATTATSADVRIRNADFSMVSKDLRKTPY
ncbi:MAG: hypothetical protein KME15_23175 [Drouetiella hepatica Uher 2000/2452]|jgi:NADPH:quinone reductase-like Zn-dependent oxidoreductase|uniref:Uncharacterized protein n=1 Tax=Drouetiella hepatica Uher 2000/2452 TaxID=904376 RepID=A0A951UPK9_9CYAN|nr:hypothetical protein [Drouetiella hepatica Uher 2000/2452]